MVGGEEEVEGVSSGVRGVEEEGGKREKSWWCRCCSLLKQLIPNH